MAGQQLPASYRAAGITRPAAYRLWRIHLEIKANTYPNVPSLAAKLEVSERTVERDLSYLRNVFQAPLDFDYRRRGYYYTEDSFNLPPLELTEGEVAALTVVARMLAQDLHTPMAPVAERALQRLIALLPGKVLVAPKDLETILSFGPDAVASEDELVRRRFDEIMHAITTKTRLQVRYYSASRQAESRRKIDPYSLYHADGSWYTIAYCHRRRTTLLFALQRFRNLAPLDERFQVPADYSPSEFMGQAWRAWRSEPEKIVLHFTAQAAPYVIERRWHPSQKITTLDDGSLEMSLTVGAEEDMIRWILSWGAQCVVLQPHSLRQTILQRVEAMHSQYMQRPPKN